MRVDQHWVEHAIWWHVYPLGFVDAPIRSAAEPAVVHRLRRLEAWLPHVVALGGSGLSLGPVFAASTHGYDTLDHDRIDPRLGDLEDFDRLVNACRASGVRLLLDGVFNHVGAEHPWYRRALAEGPDGRFARFFRIDFSGERPRPEVFEGHGQLVTLNHDEPEVADVVVEVMRRWLDRGADGWRLDAAYAVDPGFWARVLPQVRRSHPDAWFVGEVIHGDYPDVVARSRLDSVTQYELWKAIWSALKDGNFFELDWALQRHARFLDTFLPMTFVGNHDVTRIASLLGSQRALLALVVLVTTGGIPSIYYGDELDLRGVKEERVGGDDAVRPALPATPGEPTGAAQSVFRAHQDLLGLRRRHPWLVRARTRPVELTNRRYTYEAVEQDGPGRLTVELALDPPAARVLSGGEVLYASR